MKMNKSIIQQELEKEFMHLYDSHKYIIPVKLAIRKALEELKKKIFYAECSIPIDGSPIKYRKPSVEWSSVEKCFEVKDAKNK